MSAETGPSAAHMSRQTPNLSQYMQTENDTGWISFARQPDFLAARSEAVKRIKAAFDREGIVIPLPIRTLDFARSGGVKLDEVMTPSNGQSRA